MIKYYSNNYGICIYEKFNEEDQRKRYYEICFPIFTKDYILPIETKTRLEKKPSDVRQFIEQQLFNNENYKEQCKKWITTY